MLRLERLLAVADGLSLIVGLWALLLAIPGGPSLELDGLISSSDPLNPAIAFFLVQALLASVGGRRSLFVQRLVAAARVGLSRLTRRFALPGETTLVVIVIGTILTTAYVYRSADRYGPTIAGDGLGHYAYLRSLLIDGDLDFTNEFRDHGGRAALPPVDVKTPTGLVANPWPVGPALLWLPGVAATHFAMDPGSNIQDGYSQPYHDAVVFASVTYGLLGLVLAALCAARFAPAGLAFGAVAVVFWGTPALYYLTGDPPMPHSLSIFTVGLVVYLWLRWRETLSAPATFALGAAVGLCALVRFQDGLVAIVPLWSISTLSGQSVRDRLRLGLWLGAGLLLVLAPQLWAFREIFGAWMLVPQGGGFLRLTDPAVLDLLFSWHHGFVSWTPIAALLLGSVVILAVRQPAVGVPLLVFVLAEVYVAAAADDWWGGAAFGARRLVSLTAPFGVALAVVLTWCPRPGRIAVGFVSVGLALWNVVLVEGYRGGVIDDEDPVNVVAAAPDLLAARLGNSQSASDLLLISAGDVKRLFLLLAVVLFAAAIARRRTVSRA